jgi:UDP-N-acetylmuramoyl-L-alanyl-D-glutamate--2,6-diaminopimelate ligase
MFFAIPGYATDGHRYLAAACDAGAVACVVERFDEAPARDDCAFICVPNARRALALCSAAFYDWPGHALTMVGVTGTNGKTTTTFLVEAILREAGRHPGLIGTIQVKLGDEVRDARNTTPESLDLQALLAEMRGRGLDSVAMEVSSHALVLERVGGVRFDVAVFTNLTQDHLDFHGDMPSYLAAKQLLFSGLAPSAWAVINADDEAGAEMARVTEASILTYGIDGEADVRAIDVRHAANGTRLHLVTPRGEADLQLGLAGRFNVYNALAGCGAALALGVPLADVVRALERVPPVRGRFETVHEGQAFGVIVDYAHTPDGLENILRSAREITPGRLLVVFGCGGDRDRTKRPKMGALASALADVAFVTSDNPRSEDPQAILDDIVAGMGPERRVIADRREAIEAALAAAAPGDSVVIAGKGHETYQILKNETIHFDDVEVARGWLRRRSQAEV